MLTITKLLLTSSNVVWGEYTKAWSDIASNEILRSTSSCWVWGSKAQTLPVYIHVYYDPRNTPRPLVPHPGPMTERTLASCASVSMTVHPLCTTVQLDPGHRVVTLVYSGLLCNTPVLLEPWRRCHRALWQRCGVHRPMACRLTITYYLKKWTGADTKWTELSNELN